MSDVKWINNQLTQLKSDNESWYGLRHIYGNYHIYILYPSGEISSKQINFITVGFMIYLGICVIILFIQRHFDKINLYNVNKQLNIINAISTSYNSTFLLNINTMKFEPIKVSDMLSGFLKTDNDVNNIIADVSDKCVALSYKKEFRDFFEINTLKERLKNHRYLGKEVCDINGRWYSVLLIPQSYKDENLQSLLITTRDITDIKQAEELSFKDKLTGLYNRNYMELKIDEIIGNEEFPVSIIMADCNYLKRTNDTKGHEYWDLLLQRVAAVISECIPENCVAMRVGGDEFLIVGTHFSSQDADELISKIRQKLAEKSDKSLELSVSFGVNTTENGQFSFEEAYNLADKAMYKDKQKSRKSR